MKPPKNAARLVHMYDEALERLELASAVIIDDPDEGDSSVELLLTEAAYAAAKFLRAVRCCKAGKKFALPCRNIRLMFDDSLADIGPGAAGRMESFLAVFCDPNRLSFEALMKRARNHAENGTLDRLLSDEDFQQQTIDSFMFFDWCACLAHTHDSPIFHMAQVVNHHAAARVAWFSRLRNLFCLYDREIASLRTALCVPDDDAYPFWFNIRMISADDFVASFTQAIKNTPLRELPSVARFLEGLPAALRQQLQTMHIEKKLPKLIKTLGNQFAELINHALQQNTHSGACAHGAAWSYPRASNKELIVCETEHTAESDALQKLLHRIARHSDLSIQEKLTAQAIVLLASGEHETARDLLMNDRLLQ